MSQHRAPKLARKTNLCNQFLDGTTATDRIINHSTEYTQPLPPPHPLRPDMSKINEAHLGEYVPYQFQFPFNCILLCNPGSHAELMKIDDQTVVMGKQTTCWCLPQGGCPCPCCAWCGCGGFAFAPQFKIGLIEEHPDWYVGTSAIYKCGVCAGCPCMNSVNDVVKPLPDGKFGYCTRASARNTVATLICQ